MFGRSWASTPAAITDANTQAIIGYNAVMTFAFYAQKAGKDLTGQKMLDSLESGDKFLDIFNSPPTKFSKTDHLANTITQVQQVSGGGGQWGAQDDLVLHFGLGTACEADVRITWPNAEQSSQQHSLGGGYRWVVQQGGPAVPLR